MSDVYEEHVMDHYKRPRNRGTIVNPTMSYHDTNPLCGDEIDVHFTLDDEKIVSAKFTAKGCAISQAGASMLFERLEGKSLKEILGIDKQEILDEFGEALSVSRVKCALLALVAVKKAVVEYQKE